MATFSNGYQYRKLITIDYTKVGSFTGYYRLLLNHTDADLKTVANGGKVRKNPLVDIRFESIAGVKLSHETVEYSPTTGAIEAYVKLDSLSHLVNTTLWIYFGKDLTADTYQGINIGYETSTKMILVRNAIDGVENQGEITPYVTGMTSPSGGAVTQPSTEPIVGTEDGLETYVGYLMYSVADVASRFTGMSGSWNDHLILVRYSGGAWRYDNNTDANTTFTPVSTDFLIAAVSWNLSTTGRKQNYIGRLPAGEERIWNTWGDNITADDSISVVSNTTRAVVHMDEIPESTYSISSSDRFAMDFLSPTMGSGDSVTGKVGKALNFDGSTDFIRAKKDVIWESIPTGYMSFWIKPDSVAGAMCLFSQRTSVGAGTSNNVFLLAGGALRVDFGSAGLWTTGWNATAGVWQKIVIITSGTNAYLVVNGVTVASTTTDYSWDTSSSYHHVQIGASISSDVASGNYYDGLIDEFSWVQDDRAIGFFLAEYNNQNSPSTFYSLGSAEQILSLDQPGNARIEKVFSADQTGNAKIVRIDSLTQQGNARIERVENVTQPGNARIQRTEQKTQQGNARITKINSIGQTGNATLESFYFEASITQTGNATIEKVISLTQPGNARIERVENIQQTGNAAIARQDAIDQQGDARIEKIRTGTQVGRAVIIRVDQLQQTGDARIVRQEQLSQIGNARISNPSPDKRPQEWSDSDVEMPATWSEEDQLQQEWDAADDKAESTWADNEEALDQQWSDSNNTQPTEWRRQFYD